MATSGMSVKDLKALISKAGLSAADCVEKADLVKRAQEAEERLKQAAAAANAGARGGEQVLSLGGFECLTYGLSPEGGAECVVLILHGFGASSNNFEPLAKLAYKHKAAFVFPQAPEGAMGAAAWWEIDVMKWMTASMAGPEGLKKLTQEKPPGLDDCRIKLVGLLRDAYAKLGKAPSELPLVLGGFSQGAMTAMDLCLELSKAGEFNVDHVAVLSGAPIVVDEWAERLSSRTESGAKKLQVLLTHGRADQVLPFLASTWTNDLLSKHGVDVDYMQHGGGHELGGSDILDAFRKLVDRACEP